MKKKHVLIVDDAKDILFLLTHSVKRLGPDYEVDTALDASTALEQVHKKKFDLVITDYMMDDMTGLDLTQELHRISPETQVVLMSAYDTTNLRDTAKNMGLSGYIGKPFTVDQVLEVVEQAIASESSAPAGKPSPIDQDLYEPIKTLYAKTGAHYVLLLNAQGQPLYVAGRAEQHTIARLATFVASNFLAVAELASLMGDNTSVFRSNYYEGNNYNIYAYNINGEYFLAVVFSVKDKPGTVWFYTKQAAARLASFLGNDKSISSEAVEATVAAEFDDLLGTETTHPK